MAEQYKLDKKFLKICVACGKHYPNALKECPVCKKPLRGLFFRYYLGHCLARPLLITLRLLFVVLLCLGVTYGIQVDQRPRYIEAFSRLKTGDFLSDWQQIRLALAEHPLYKYARSLTAGSKSKIDGITPDAPKGSYTLKVIYFDASGNKPNSALINDRILFEGESMGNFKLVRVNTGSIDIESAGKQKNIKFSASWD